MNILPWFPLSNIVLSSRVPTLATWPGRPNERTWAVWTHSATWRSVLPWLWTEGSSHSAESSLEWPSPRECVEHLCCCCCCCCVSTYLFLFWKKSHYGTEHDQSSPGLPMGPEGAGACCLVLWLALRGPHWWIHDFCPCSRQKGYYFFREKVKSQGGIVAKLTSSSLPVCLCVPRASGSCWPALTRDTRCSEACRRTDMERPSCLKVRLFSTLAVSHCDAGSSFLGPQYCLCFQKVWKMKRQKKKLWMRYWRIKLSENKTATYR